MSETTKTILILGGAAVGGYLIVKALTPTKTSIPSNATGTLQSQQQAAFIGGLIPGVLGNIFRSSSGNASAPTSPYAGSDAASVSSWNAVSTQQLDVLQASDTAAGVEGPF